MDGDADVLGAADRAFEQGYQIPMHRPMIRPELGLHRFQVEKGALSIADGIVAVYGNAYALYPMEANRRPAQNKKSAWTGRANAL
jgi:hypothetical protein